VRRSERAERRRDALRLAVVQIRKLKAATLGVSLHFFQRIAQVGVTKLIQSDGQRIVGRNRHE
jgi:hypothetical protein